MEPMNLGSPVSSPGAIGGSGNNQSQYLPPFLMGDPQAAMTPHNNTLSPKPGGTRGYNVGFVTSPGAPASGQATPQADYNRSMNLSTRSLFGGAAGGNGSAATSMSTGGVGSGGHQAGPPTQGLFDSIRDGSGSTPHRNHLNMLGLQSQHFNQTPNQHNFSLNQSYQNESFTPNAPNAINASMRALCSPLGANISSLPTTAVTIAPRNADFWVTIFGYSPGASSMILQHFTICGTIVDVVHAPQNGNWMHVRFSSRIESDKALNYNQKVIAGNVMVGVTRCSDKSIIDKENCNLNSCVSDTSETPSTPKVRPFAQQSYKLAHNDNTVSPTHKNVPQKSSGLVNKAMDLIFGW